MSCPGSVFAFSGFYSLLLLLLLTLTNCVKRKIVSQFSNPSIASTSTTRVAASNSVMQTPSQSKIVPKEESQKKSVAKEIPPEKTQLSTPIRSAVVKQPPFNPSVDAIDLEDEDEDTRDDAPSLKAARPDLPSTTVTKVTAKTKIKLKSNDLVKEDLTVGSDRTVREVRATSARKLKTTKKKEMQKEMATAREKQRSRRHRKNEDDVQCTQEHE